MALSAGQYASMAEGTIGINASIYGAVNAGKKRKQMEQYLNQQDAENKAWYNENALSDYTQRADTQNLMRQLRNTLDRQNQIASNTAVITGATPEQQAVQKEQSNKVVADTYSNIGAMGQKYKDSITNRYLAIRSNIANQRMGMWGDQANNYENLMNTGLQTIGDSVRNFAGGGGGGGDGGGGMGGMDFSSMMGGMGGGGGGG